MSHDPSDYFEHGALSSCCSAPLMLGAICSHCKEHCDTEGEQAEREFTCEQQAIIERMQSEAREP